MTFLSPGGRMGLAYAAIFVTFGVHLPFYPVLLNHRGLSDTEIALVIGIPTLFRVATAPMLGIASDRVRDRRLAVLAYAVAALLAFAFFPVATGFWTILAVMIVTAVAWNGVLPGAEAIAVGLVRRDGADYGRMRLWGSVSFIAATLISGLIVARTDAGMIFWLLAAAFALQVIAVAAMPPVEAAAAAEGRPAVRFADLFGHGALIAVMIGTACIHASHAMHNSFASLAWTAQGMSEATIGVVWIVGVIAEITLFAAAGRIVARVNPVTLIAVGGLVAAARWLIYPSLASPVAWGAVQAMHAFSYGAVHIGTMAYLTRAALPGLAGSAQSLLVTFNGLFMALATFASGALYKTYGLDGFPAMALVAMAGVVIVTLFARRPQPQSAGSGG